MEKKQIREEAEILSRLIRARNLGGIKDEEWQKMLSKISDETILEVAKSGFFSKEAAEILKERMKKWPDTKLIEATKQSDRRLSELADEVLVEKMTRWSIPELRKALQDEDPRIVTAALEAEKRIKEINQLRGKLGIDPLP